jgi:hypothetical protein
MFPKRNELGILALLVSDAETLNQIIQDVPDIPEVLFPLWVLRELPFEHLVLLV